MDILFDRTAPKATVTSFVVTIPFSKNGTQFEYKFRWSSSDYCSETVFEILEETRESLERDVEDFLTEEEHEFLRTTSFDVVEGKLGQVQAGEDDEG